MLRTKNLTKVGIIQYINYVISVTKQIVINRLTRTIKANSTLQGTFSLSSSNSNFGGKGFAKVCNTKDTKVNAILQLN
jgi:hypothetical protein